MNYIYKDELYHHGIKGQRWGVRRFQYENGTLTPDGRKRYEVVVKERRNFVDKLRENDYRNYDNEYNKEVAKAEKSSGFQKRYHKQRARLLLQEKVNSAMVIKNRKEAHEDAAYDRMSKVRSKFMKKYGNCEVSYNIVTGSYTIRADGPAQIDKKELAKKVALGAAVVGGTLLAAYGAAKINGNRSNHSLKSEKKSNGLGVSTFKPESFDFDTFDFDTFKPASFKKK